MNALTLSSTRAIWSSYTFISSAAETSPSTSRRLARRAVSRRGSRSVTPATPSPSAHPRDAEAVVAHRRGVLEHLGPRQARPRLVGAGDGGPLQKLRGGLQRAQDEVAHLVDVAERLRQYA